MTDTEFDFVIVGSGAGGGPLAANLARAGYTVCLMDAGKWPKKDYPNYDVPVFHAFATEDPELAWYTYVRHYESAARQKKDDKYQKSGVPDRQAHADGDDPPMRFPRWQPKDGVFYPRASGVGGCTTHHAHICVYPHNADWDEIVERTGDWTWNSENMRRYFEKLERCRYRPLQRFLHKVFGWNPSRHGYDGWLTTQYPKVTLLLEGKQLLRVVLRAVFTAFKRRKPNIFQILKMYVLRLGDANTWSNVKNNAVGLRLPALSIDGVKRSAAREFVQSVMDEHPGRLVVMTRVLVEKVLFEDRENARDPLREGGDRLRARGVRYYQGDDLYEACAAYDPEASPGRPREIQARREVILAGGAFSTPQVLMLSGIGDAKYLRSRKVGMLKKNVLIDLPGVGKNLQDRYEVGLEQTMKKDFSVLNGATFRADQGDPLYREWAEGKNGVYTTNGAVIAMIMRSRDSRPLPDLYIFGLVGPFRGYAPSYSLDIRKTHRSFTWVILKAHTNNRGGEVLLNKDEPLNPRRSPHVNFKYFAEGTEDGGEDLDSLVRGVKFVRRITRETDDLIEEEAYPGHVLAPTHDEAKIRDWIANNAWGHHASCTCPIGRESEIDGKGNKDGIKAVLDSKFRVLGTENLRVVDASVFPRIPGFFIVLPLYMASEKAAEQIILDAQAADRREGRGRPAREAEDDA